MKVTALFLASIAFLVLFGDEGGLHIQLIFIHCTNGSVLVLLFCEYLELVMV